jgi:hypothetical protein
VAEEPTPEQLAEQIRKLKIEDILLSTVATLGQLSYVKIEAKELEQARLAIDAIAALLPTLEQRTEDQVIRDFKQLLANVRLAYTDAVSASGSEPQTPQRDAGEEPPPAESASDGDEGETESSEESAGGSEPQTRQESS